MRSQAEMRRRWTRLLGVCLTATLAGLIVHRRWARRGQVAPEMEGGEIVQDQDQDQDNYYYKPAIKFSNEQLDLIANSAWFESRLASNWLLAGEPEVAYLSEPSQDSYIECDNFKELPLKEEQEQLTLVILVNSARWNWARRKRLRESWLARDRLKEQVCHRPRNRIRNVKLLFSLGTAAAAKVNQTSSPQRPEVGEVNGAGNLSAPKSAARQQESGRLGNQILELDLKEDYKSLTIKHLASLKYLVRWARRRQEVARWLLLKCDDDLELNLGRLLDLHEWRSLEWMSQPSRSKMNPEVAFNQEKSNWIMCAQFGQATPVQRSPTSKWRLSVSEFPYASLPAYCSGLAYLAPMKLIERLLIVSQELSLASWSGSSSSEAEAATAAQRRRPLWVDDVYVTGLLPVSLVNPLRFVRLNGHFCYTRALRLHRAKLGVGCMAAELPD